MASARLKEDVADEKASGEMESFSRVGAVHDADQRWGLLASYAWMVVAYGCAVAAALLVGLYAIPSSWNPVVQAFVLDMLATAAIFVFSFVFQNSSFVDNVWNLSPVAIALYWAIDLGRLEGGDENGAAVAWALLAVITLWAARLTHNWASGWTGLGHEDWRYVDMKQKTGPAYWLVSFFGLHVFPSVMVFGCLVSVYAALAAGSRFNVGHGVAVAVSALSVVGEFTADQQLRTFASRPGRQPGSCIDEGLWRYSRHPNYFFQALFWFGLWIFAVSSDARSAWTWGGLAGPAALTAMLLGASVPLMEERLLRSRPDAYAAYQQRVRSPFVPWFRSS